MTDKLAEKARAARERVRRNQLRTDRPCSRCKKNFARVNGSSCTACERLYHRERGDRRKRREYRPQKYNPAKGRARTLLNYAVRHGHIVKPDSCETCGGNHGRIEAHHPDYAKPLAVIWLCRRCHARIHWKEAA